MKDSTVASLALEPGTISDLFSQEERGTPMALTAIAPLLGPVVAPVIGSYLSQAKGWRWVFWLILITEGFFDLLSIFFFRETYRVRILQKKTQRMRKETGDLSLPSEYEGPKGKELFKQTIIRPVRLFCFSPIVSSLSLYTTVVLGYLYLIFTTETQIFESLYGFSEGNVGLVFLGIGEWTYYSVSNYIHIDECTGLGALIGVLLCSVASYW